MILGFRRLHPTAWRAAVTPALSALRASVLFRMYGRPAPGMFPCPPPLKRSLRPYADTFHVAPLSSSLEAVTPAIC
eukprot:3594097-Pyramimonas_sp.AAC.4